MKTFSLPRKARTLLDGVVGYLSAEGYWCRDVEIALFMAYCLSYREIGNEALDVICEEVSPFESRVHRFMDSVSAIVVDEDEKDQLKSAADSVGTRVFKKSLNRFVKRKALKILMVRVRSHHCKKALVEMRLLDASFERSAPVLEGVV